jgi:hypothetical protein
MRMDTQLTHLRREARTALELAIVALAPDEIIDGLAVSTGLLEALNELPGDNSSVLAMAEVTAKRARKALQTWREWEKKHAGQA